MEFGDMSNDFFGFVIGDLALPHHRREHQNKQHGHPHNGRLAKAILLVAHKHRSVNDEPHNAPGHQNHKGFRGDGIHVPKGRRQREEKEERRNRDTENSGKVHDRLAPAHFTTGHLDDSCRNIQVNDGGANRSDIYNPADGGSSGKRDVNMITTLPIDILKIDMSFVRNMEKDERNLKLVELVASIAKFLKIPSVAEGVETESQLNTLKDMGCKIIQGYFFSKPVPPKDFVPFIEKELERRRGA